MAVGQRTLSMDAQGKPIAEKHETVLLAFTTAISVGVSWETYHFEASFGMFSSVCQQVEYLLQMLRRFRKLMVTEVFLGSSMPPKETFESKMRAATNTTEKYNNADSISMDDELVKVYRRKHNAMVHQSRSCVALKKAFNRATYSSNAFNVIRDVPECSDVGAAAVVTERLSNDSIEAILNAKPLHSESELSDALPEEKHRFNMLNRFFEGNKLPPELSAVTLRSILVNFKNIKFYNRLLTGSVKTVSHLVIDNFTDDTRVNLLEASKLIESLGFNDYSHFLKWNSAATSRKGRPSKSTTKTRKLKEFEFDAGLVGNASNRLKLGLEDKPRKKQTDKQTQVVNTLRCLNAIIKEECPMAQNKSITGVQRQLHGYANERCYRTDEAFFQFVASFMAGTEPTVTWPSADQKKKKLEQVGEADADPEKPFDSHFGTVLNYKTFF
jgi:hypothetical protein